MYALSYQSCTREGVKDKLPEETNERITDRAHFDDIYISDNEDAPLRLRQKARPKPRPRAQEVNLARSSVSQPPEKESSNSQDIEGDGHGVEEQDDAAVNGGSGENDVDSE